MFCKLVNSKYRLHKDINNINIKNLKKYFIM
jgi:hypothetical protein